ncbi:hypothetical protein BYT27DRAFT_7336731 [Phlegmacium glaucopus]|nr:hypothetical protein BYT27DRAFT_7336731 [Phlegmacium glaucopus]
MSAEYMNQTTVPDDGDSTDGESTDPNPTSDQSIPMLAISMKETTVPEGGESTDPNPITNQPTPVISMIQVVQLYNAHCADDPKSPGDADENRQRPSSDRNP